MRECGISPSTLDCVVSGLRSSGGPEPAEMARRYGPEVTVIVSSERLICSHFSSRILFLMSWAEGPRDHNLPPRILRLSRPPGE
jgi:hypothetical protein